MTTGFGVFGKFPGTGDFLRQGLPASFVQVWDTWLQEGMTTLREVLGAAWDERYYSAPIWRFTLPAGLAGSSAVSGVLMASVDSVGRQYPLTIAIPHDNYAPAITHFANRTLFERLEEIALSALEDTATRDTLLHALAPLRLIQPKRAALHGTAYVGALPPAQVLAADAVRAQHGDAALWSAMMEGNHRMQVTRALPQGAQLQALFDLAAPMWQQTLAAEAL